jgi:chorismate mutase
MPATALCAATARAAPATTARSSHRRAAAADRAARGTLSWTSSHLASPSPSPPSRRSPSLLLRGASAASTGPGDASISRDESDRLSLDNIRASLIRQEDSIIFGLIERAQYLLNAPVYQPGKIDVPCFHPDGTRASMLEFMLRESEQLGGKIRRYTSPDEHAFYPESLPLLVIGAMRYENPLAPAADGININDRIMEMYVNDILPALCQAGDDFNYGSAGLADVNCLQTISKRIHYGKFVAESKFQAKPEEFTELIKKQDAEGLMSLLTYKAVEDRVVRRVTNKAATYGQDISDGDVPDQVAALGEGVDIEYKVAPERVGELYYKWIMPMTKDVQVEYLLRRLDHL